MIVIVIIIISLLYIHKFMYVHKQLVEGVPVPFNRHPYKIRACATSFLCVSYDFEEIMMKEDIRSAFLFGMFPHIQMHALSLNSPLLYKINRSKKIRDWKKLNIRLE